MEEDRPQHQPDPRNHGANPTAVNRLLNPEHQYYQLAGTRAEIHRRMKLHERLAVEGLKLKAKSLFT